MGDLLMSLSTACGVIGAIGSFVLAYVGGKTIEIGKYGISYERNWLLTIAIFLGVAFSVAVVSAALYALGEIYNEVFNISFKVTKTGDNHIPREDREKQDEAVLKNGGWKCSKCGKVHYGYESSCSCGKSRYADMN